jgi:hypothetical protein
VAERASVEVVAELQNFRKQMATMPGIGATEARDMVNGINRQLRRAEAAAKNTASNMDKDFSRSFGKVSLVAERSLGRMGGMFGTVGDLAFDVVAPLGEVTAGLGAAGLAVGGVTIALTAAAASAAIVTAGLVAMTNAAVSAEERLEKAGMAAVLPAEARQNLDSFTNATENLRNEWDRFIVLVGSEFADELAVNISFVTEAVSALSNAFSFATDEIGPFIREVHRFTTLGLSEHVYEAREAFIAHRLEVSNNEAAYDNLVSAIQSFAVIRDAVTKANKKDTKVVKENTAAYDDLVASHKEFEENRLNSITEAQLRTEESLQAGVEAERERADILIELRAKEAAEITRLNEEAADAAAAAWDEAHRQMQAGNMTLYQTTQNVLSAIADSFTASARARIAAGEELSDEERKQAYRAFQRGQELQAAGAIIEGIRSAVALIPAFAYLGPGAPVAAAAVAGTATGIALAGIYGQPAPEFPVGRSPDHQLVGVQRTEGIANNRAMSDPEFADHLRRANRGERQGSQGDQSRVYVELDPRLNRIRVTTDRRVGKAPRRRR